MTNHVNLLKIFQYCFLAVIIFSFLVPAQQITINRIEMMPNLPEPYLMRNWKQVAIEYDAYVFDFNKTGLYLPLIWWRTNLVNYPNHSSFGLHTVVGTHSPTSAEAINVIPAVISASLVGIDKSNQNGYNWALMCEEYFNKANGANVYLNHPTGSAWDDWWYDTMPNIFFYQLYDFYPGTGEFLSQFTSVADRWLSAIEVMGGSATPWQVPSMNYRAFNLMTMTPYASGVCEPEAAGALAWLLYMAYVETGNSDYRIGAEWALEFLNNWASNPAYELQLSYGTYIASRMNAEIGTNFNIEKFLNWCFEVGSLRNWGAIVGNWGGYDCSGLIGEVSYNDYAFTMNTFEQMGALVPLVRYDDRFARAIGKWVLNATNAARLFYSNYLPDENQDCEFWSHLYDSSSVIAYEALHEYDPYHPSISPFATGDAVSGGWGYTNLTLYGSSHVGILGGIIDTTEIERILILDLLRTDYFHAPAYPSCLIFNPYTGDTTIAFNSGTGRHDIYDAVSNSFLVSNVSGIIPLTIPGNSAVVIVVTPAGGSVSYDLDKMLIDGVVVDYRSGQVVSNYPPRIKALKADVELVTLGAPATIYCTAVDRENQSLSYDWNSSGGVISGQGATVSWTAPSVPGKYTVYCLVSDGSGGQDSSSVEIEVVEFINHNPVITSLTAVPRKIDLGARSNLTCAANDPDGDSLSYFWQAVSGSIQDSGSTAVWNAPTVPGNYWVSCEVQDGQGGIDRDSIAIMVRDFSTFIPGKIIAFYPFNGNANDASGHDHHGIVSGAVLTADRFGHPNSAYYFDGINDHIRIPNHDSLNVREAISINFWMNIGQLFNREAFPISHGSWENRWKVSLIPGDRLRWTIKTGSGITDLDSDLLFVINTWYNITVTYNGSDFELYVDGELNSFSQWSGLISPTTYDLMIGQRLPNDYNYNFRGILDDIRIYDYALSVQEIQDLYHLTAINNNLAECLPVNFTLSQNFPNPFNPNTTIHFTIPSSTPVTLSVYDVTGKKIEILINQKLNPGSYIVSWKAANCASGVYFYRLEADGFVQSRKMVLLR